ncbi:hypothetical protein CR513_32965, partial [Mucuna pruriens]
MWTLVRSLPCVCVNSTNGGYFRYERFLFKEKRLCVPRGFIRKLLVREAHKGGFMGHFGELEPHRRGDVHHICERCLVCKKSKSKSLPHGLYISLPSPTPPWVDISMDFVLGLPRYSKMTYFIPSYKVVRHHGIPKSIVLYKNFKFFGHFEGSYGVRLTLSYYFPPLVIHKQMDKPKCFVRKSLRSWVERLLHIEFAYNRVANSITSHSLFDLVYGFNHLSPLDLLPLPNVYSMINSGGFSKAQFVKNLHEKARLYMEKKVEQCQVVRHHAIPRSIVLDMDFKFLGHFEGPYEVRLTLSYYFPPLEWLPHIEFAYNRVVNSTTSHSLFDLVYGFNPLSQLDLLPLPNISSIINSDGFSKA